MKEICKKCESRGYLDSRYGEIIICNYIFTHDQSKTKTYKDLGHEIRESYGKNECLVFKEGDALEPYYNDPLRISTRIKARLIK